MERPNVINLGEAMRIALSKTKQISKNPYQKEWIKKKMQEPGWWEKQLQKQSERRRGEG